MCLKYVIKKTKKQFMKTRNIFAIAGLAFAVALTSCGGNKSNEDEAARKQREADSLAAIEQAIQDSIAAANAVKDLNTTIAENTELSTFNELVGIAGFATKLADATANYTVFAPTNAAFNAVANLEALKTDVKKRQELADIVGYHIVSGKYSSTDVANAEEFDALAEKIIKVTKDNGTVKVGGASIVTADIEATNGTIHVIDVVMTAPKAKAKSTKAPVKAAEPTKTEPAKATRGSGTSEDAPKATRGSSGGADKSDAPKATRGSGN